VPLAISLSGVAGAGKTTFARYLVHEFGCQRFSWSHPMKIEFFDALASGTLPAQLPPVTRTPPELSYPPDKVMWVDAHKRELRAPLQAYATEYRRAQDPDYWLKAGIEQIERLQTMGISVVVDDTRFPDELQALRANGFETIRIKVSPELQEERLIARDGSFDPAIRAHVSETALLVHRFPIEIDNSRDLARLHAQARGIATRRHERGVEFRIA
jgi:dephospho-CoA kinase